MKFNSKKFLTAISMICLIISISGYFSLALLITLGVALKSVKNSEQSFCTEQAPAHNKAVPLREHSIKCSAKHTEKISVF